MKPSIAKLKYINLYEFQELARFVLTNITLISGLNNAFYRFSRSCRESNIPSVPALVNSRSRNITQNSNADDFPNSLSGFSGSLRITSNRNMAELTAL